MSKHMDSGVDGDPEPSSERTETVDAELAALRKEAKRLRTADTDPRRGRWPASDYY